MEETKFEAINQCKASFGKDLESLDELMVCLSSVANVSVDDAKWLKTFDKEEIIKLNEERIETVKTLINNLRKEYGFKFKKL